MANSIFSTFIEVKSNSKKRGAKKTSAKSPSTARVKTSKPSQVKATAVTVTFKSSPQAASSNTTSAPKVLNSSASGSNRQTPQGRKRAGTDLVIASLLPGAPRQQGKISRQRPPLVFTVPRYPHLQNSKRVNAVAQAPATVLRVATDADLIWNSGYQDSIQLLSLDESNGVPAQMSGQLGRNREMVVGIDFGTSCVKVVLGDRGASKAYAVPFLDAPGVKAYLLPSRLFEQSGTFSLINGTNVHRDLKLRFLANPTSSHLQETLVGFLALVIRRCRAWLFSAHAETLANRNILWKLVLGRAVERVQNDRLGLVMADILQAAWMVAGTVDQVGRAVCSNALTKHRYGKTVGDDLPEVSVVPELAAQIYGFVKSRQFDPRAKNFYLFVDVGAGTVDVSLFRVKPNQYGTWDFSLFTSIVEPNGSMNLHRARLEWWRQQLSKVGNAKSEELQKKIKTIESPTEQTQPIPEDYAGYFNGLQVQYSGGALSPDDSFYMNRLVLQVRGQGIHRTVQSKIVGRVDLDNLPFFLCGGGARLPLYKNIETALNQAPEFKWLKAHRRVLGIPDELDAPGLAAIDYDRLSVAFGLSFVDVGTVVVAQAMPSIMQRSKVDWQSWYTDKDTC